MGVHLIGVYLAKGKLGGIGVTCIGVIRPIVKWGVTVFQRFNHVVATLALFVQMCCSPCRSKSSNEISSR
jgi:hypothetical protein